MDTCRMTGPPNVGAVDAQATNHSWAQAFGEEVDEDSDILNEH
jgi:hypothetical protein